jgi:hypothetical protein
VGEEFEKISRLLNKISTLTRETTLGQGLKNFRMEWKQREMSNCSGLKQDKWGM